MMKKWAKACRKKNVSKPAKFRVQLVAVMESLVKVVPLALEDQHVRDSLGSFRFLVEPTIIIYVGGSGKWCENHCRHCFECEASIHTRFI